MWKKLTIIAVATVLAVACLEEEIEHTIYLDPDGSATWMILEKEIRSDSPEELRKEFLEPFERGEHPLAEYLAALGPTHLESRLLRAEPPYWALTTARFPSIDGLLQAYLDDEEYDARVWLERDGDTTRLLVTVWTDDVLQESGPAAEEGEEENLNPLFEDEFRIFLTDGEFAEAVGFEISEDGSVATAAELREEGAARGDGTVTLSLTWTTAP